MYNFKFKTINVWLTVTILFCVVETCGGEPCDGCGGRGTGSGAREAKSRGTVLHLGLTHVQVPTESGLIFVNLSFHVHKKNTFQLNANRPPFWQYGIPVR